MEEKKKTYDLGIDLNDAFAMVSYYQPDMDEPDTVSAVAGSELYHIPAILARRQNLGLWYYGDEAKRMAKTSEVICVDSLLWRAVNHEVISVGEENYEAVELLALFLRRVIELPQKLGSPGAMGTLVLSVERLNKENMEVFWRVASLLSIPPDKFMVTDHKESFYYYALSQKEELWLHKVFLFECTGDTVSSYELKRDRRTKPQVVSIHENSRASIEGERDEAFLRLLQKSFEGHMISTVYLVGDGFDGGWMEQSLNYLCRGRRAFLGKNLFSKGACYAAAARGRDWPCIYMGENEMKFNLSLKVRDKGTMAFHNLVSAGRNWFEAMGECEVILSGTGSVDFWKQLPNSREAKIETLELTDLPPRPDKTTRVRILAKPVSDDRIEIEIRDLGFGEFFRGTDKIWKYTMSM
ncbi:MAG: DUF5716 family protein [Muribaculaceae bacterium]|nr:DUF5716 family protein [Roseburia sp.]MCM1430304.1 DUF5716 family protein [Muribaculaceae bacterium]MCM1492500.1 DUF5716 family protein [Muribaculaceae bacterium]